mmetsp:Transcript_39968/g.96485  ORF Transcript_39968/g.96485 Transcript_39968/m.96485 type:complete len:113 (-) Transcript_39968:307-645(-)
MKKKNNIGRAIINREQRINIVVVQKPDSRQQLLRPTSATLFSIHFRIFFIASSFFPTSSKHFSFDHFFSRPKNTEQQDLSTESVQRLSLTLESVDDVHRRDGLPAGMFSVRD